VTLDASPIHVWLVPTPVGNLGDITLRAIEVLRGADAVACEDTRRSGQLLTHLGISRPLVRLDAHTMKRAPGVLEQYPRLAYVSDAGTPGISDPGAELLALALELGGKAEVLPGPTAFVPALVLSGLDGGRFTFEGFLPRGGRERRERLQAVAGAPRRPSSTRVPTGCMPRWRNWRNCAARSGGRASRGNSANGSRRRCAAPCLVWPRASRTA